jgi:hypothetical protein
VANNLEAGLPFWRVLRLWLTKAPFALHKGLSMLVMMIVSVGENLILNFHFSLFKRLNEIGQINSEIEGVE